MVSQFSIQVENALIRYGKKIIQKQIVQRRIADMVISLYSTACVLSRATKILNDDSVSKERKAYVRSLSEISCRESRQVFMENLKRMRDNYDKHILSASRFISEEKDYALDIIDY